MDLNGVLTLIPWRRVIRLGRLSHCVLIFVVLCSFVKFSQFSLQPEEMYPGESHRKRKLFYETNKRNLTSPEERGPEPPAETRLLGGGGGGGEEEGAENPILNRVYAWEDNNSSTSESFPYRYLINEEKACNEMTEIINIVPIAPSSVSSRKMIRELWASPKHQNISLMTTLFLVGLPPSGQLQEIINKESMDFHDIIQVEFVDSYLNLTLKTLSILHWTENFCPNASWILKSDEDVFVNSFALKDYLHHISNGKSLRNAFVCRMNKDLKVCRSENECIVKWIIPKTLYPSDYYPAYCNGPAYVISSPLARKIFESANKTHPFLMEDVYYTGILAKGHNPRYISLRRRSFPSKFWRLKPYHWNGKSLFISDVEEVKGYSHVLWNKILENYHLRKK